MTRAALVTGGASGIGFAIATMLAGEGYNLTLVARRTDRLDAAATALRAAGADVATVAADLADEDSIRRAIAAHAGRFGRLDLLVNNAGMGFGHALEGYPTDRLDALLAVNLRALVLSYRESLALLKAAAAEHGRALVINLSSVLARSGRPWLSVYSATKAAVTNFTETMNHELAPFGIRSCALAPAFVDTEMTGFVKGRVPAEEMIRPSDVAEVARCLLRLSATCVISEVVLQRAGDL